MDRQLLSKILVEMRNHLKEGKEIGDLKLGALLALGHQLEAIFYYLGHELGTHLNVKPIGDVNTIPNAIKEKIGLTFK